MPSKYQQGDVISLTFGFLNGAAVENFQIIRVLPANEKGQRQYRVRGADGVERKIEAHKTRSRAEGLSEI